MSNKKKDLLNNKKKGLLFIVSAPAGTGKTTLIEMLCNEFSNVIKNISYTTRKIRITEQQNKDYHFISKEEFEKKIANDEFLEFVSLYDDYYGTTSKSVEEIINAGKHVVLVIDTQGAVKLKNKVNAIFIFIEPPSLEVLKKRLTERKTEEQAMIEKRLNWAKIELEAKESYDYHIINDDLNTSYDILRSIVIAEEHRNRKKDKYGN